MSCHRSSVGLRWPSKHIAALHRWPIRSVWAARCALRCAPMAARSLRHLIGDATPVSRHEKMEWPVTPISRLFCAGPCPILRPIHPRLSHAHPDHA
ncbi:hypothetical protein [Verminephrobacter eiseniae]|uniref:hypothetical protein n=1 Tax=Verminephrobacter eiseniae TaxID=364317 RepID=UPI002237585C|nr:hypothetical protein [Verminephrobacter eiseniae]